jgi:hypothetical protein
MILRVSGPISTDIGHAKDVLNLVPGLGYVRLYASESLGRIVFVIC